MQVPPNDAVANACKWSALFTHECPDWLRASNVPKWAPLLLYALAACLLLWIILPPFIPRKHRKTDYSKVAELKPEITIVIGHGGRYEHAKNANLYLLSKTLSIGVKNIGATYLSNCKVYCEIIDRDKNVPLRWLREDTFTLNVGEERLITIASYNEPIPPHPKGEEEIRLHAPIGNGYGGFMPTLPSEGGALTITASCAECMPCEIICKLWVKEGKFQWEQASGSIMPASNRDAFVPMPEAAARAYGELRVAKSSWAKAADFFAQQGVRDVKERIYIAGALSGEIPIYGKHPPSSIYEIIDSDEFKRGSFEEDGATFHYDGERNPRYIEIAVKNDDLSKAIEQMRDRLKDVAW